MQILPLNIIHFNFLLKIICYITCLFIISKICSKGARECLRECICIRVLTRGGSGRDLMRFSATPTRQTDRCSRRALISFTRHSPSTAGEEKKFILFNARKGKGRKRKMHDGTETCKSLVRAYSYAMRCKRYTLCVFYKSCGDMDLKKARPERKSSLFALFCALWTQKILKVFLNFLLGDGQCVSVIKNNVMLVNNLKFGNLHNIAN